jgi:hypothetical protein
MSDGFNQNFSSITGLYNVNCDDLSCDTFEFNYLDKIPETFFNDIKSNVQNQITYLQTEIDNMNQSTIAGQISYINGQITTINNTLSTLQPFIISISNSLCSNL